MAKTPLSPIIAGTMNWGIWDKKLSEKEMAHMIHVCLENRITTFDHADIYGAYTTETEFGKAFSSSGISSDSRECAPISTAPSSLRESTGMRRRSSNADAISRSCATGTSTSARSVSGPQRIHRCRARPPT